MAKRKPKTQKSRKSRKSQKMKSMKEFGKLIEEHPDNLCHIDLIVGTNEETYESARKNGTPVFARVHAKWCGHCQSMKQDWEDLKKWHMANVKDKTSPLHSTLLVSVEDTELPQLTEKYPELQADGFPTLMMVKNGKVVKPYSGPRNLEAFKTFMSSGMHGGRKSRRKSRKTRKSRRRKSRRRRSRR